MVALVPSARVVFVSGETTLISVLPSSLYPAMIESTDTGPYTYPTPITIPGTKEVGALNAATAPIDVSMMSGFGTQSLGYWKEKPYWSLVYVLALNDSSTGDGGAGVGLGVGVVAGIGWGRSEERG